MRWRVLAAGLVALACVGVGNAAAYPEHTGAPWEPRFSELVRMPPAAYAERQSFLAELRRQGVEYRRTKMSPRRCGKGGLPESVLVSLPPIRRVISMQPNFLVVFSSGGVVQCIENRFAYPAAFIG